ncbi:MAG: hypothetical protein J1E96_00680 [Ruminococcus sp.]|nr:hypothetical protein [Ruminococcus sp.]
MKNKKERRFSISAVFRNNKFLIVISVFLAIAIWIWMSLGDTNESVLTVTNIPIQINLSDEAVDDGLEIFSGADQTASVTVTGNRVSLGSISAEDIIVSAQTAGTITTPNTYTLSLSARKANPSDNFEITSTVSPSVVVVVVDHKRESTFNVKNEIKYNVSEGYHAAATLSSDSITVTGPQTELSKISYVSVTGKIRGELKDDTSLECDVKLFDNLGFELTNNLFVLSEEKVTANFSVLPEKEIPLEISFKNKPSGIKMENFVEISPNKILVAAPQDVLDELESIKTTDVDFNTLSNKKNTLELSLDIPSMCTNLSETETVDATIDLSSFNTRHVNTSNISVKNLDLAYSYSVSTEHLNVTLKGKKSELDDINASNIICDVDASGIDGVTGSITLPATVRLSDSKSCWVYGEYQVNIYVTTV